MKHEETWKAHWHHTQMCEDNLCWVCWLYPINQKCSLLPPQGHCSACCPSQLISEHPSFFFHQFAQFGFEKSTRLTQWNHFSCFVHFSPLSHPIHSCLYSLHCLQMRLWSSSVNTFHHRSDHQHHCFVRFSQQVLSVVLSAPLNPQSESLESL